MGIQLVKVAVKGPDHVLRVEEDGRMQEAEKNVLLLENLAIRRRNYFAKLCKNTRKAKSKVHQVDETQVETESDNYTEYTMFNLKLSSKEEVFNENKDDCYMISLNIEDTEIDMEIDTGSRCTVINKLTFDRLCGKATLLNTRNRLTTYLGEEISVKGHAKVNVSHNNQKRCLELLNVDGKGPNSVGRNWIRELKLDWASVFRCHRVTTHLKESQIYTDYKELFQDGLGTFKGPKIKIHVEDNVQPRFYKARVVPFAHRSLVENELDRLVKDEVISPVEFSEWATPVVPILKLDGKIKICGNYAVTINQVAKGDSRPISNIDDLYNKLRGGVLYTKLDLGHAYQQLVLEESSGKYTAINTSKGLFQYNRVPFGMGAAPGLFQRTMDNLLQDIPMTAVYLDDIFISGKTIEEHDNNLKKVMNKLQEHGLRT